MRKFMKKNWCVAFVALALCATAACKKSDTGKNQVKKIGILMRTLEALGTEEAAEIRECIRQNAGNLNPRSGFTPLMLAATKNATDVAKLLIKAGADVNAKDEDDRSALIYAADDNAIELAQLLIKSGADMNAKDRYDRTALMKAAVKNELDFARLLIKSGADVNARDEDDETALMKAARFSEDMTKLLIAEKADVNAKNNINQTALMFAVKYNAVDIAKMLIKEGVDINAKDWQGETALMYAAKRNQIENLKFLLEAGADMYAKDKDGYTVLMAAAEGNAADTAKLFIEAGMDVNAKMDSKPRPLSSGWIGADWVDSYQMIDDWTALMLAAYRNAADVARLLIKAGADVNTKTNEGKTALTLAFEAEADMNREKPTPIKYEVIDVLKAAGAKE